jgi:hypothetical protein
MDAPVLLGFPGRSFSELSICVKGASAMRIHSLLSLFPLLCFALGGCLPAAAQQQLYENGPINGSVDAWTINFGFAVSNTITISGGTSTVQALSFGAWLFPGDVLQTAEVSITSDEFGGTLYYDGVVTFTASGCAGNQYGYNVCTETGSFDGPTLENGTYWLTLQNAVVNNGDPIYWDENSGIGCHSEGCPSRPSENSIGSIPPESFTILGTVQTGTGSTPEPGGLILFGSGAIGVLSVLRRRFRSS